MTFSIVLFSHGATEERSESWDGGREDADIDFEATKVRTRG